MYVHRQAAGERKMFSHHVDLYLYRKCRLQAIQIRRLQNSIARCRGFRNFKEMAGGE